MKTGMMNLGSRTFLTGMFILVAMGGNAVAQDAPPRIEEVMKPLTADAILEEKEIAIQEAMEAKAMADAARAARKEAKRDAKLAAAERKQAIRDAEKAKREALRLEKKRDAAYKEAAKEEKAAKKVLKEAEREKREALKEAKRLLRKQK